MHPECESVCSRHGPPLPGASLSHGPLHCKETHSPICSGKITHAMTFFLLLDLSVPTVYLEDVIYSESIIKLK